MKWKKGSFVYLHNSARSRMAEAFLNRLCGEEFEVDSAGLELGKLNPVVVEAMREIGVDLSGNRTKSVFNVIKSGKLFAYASFFRGVFGLLGVDSAQFCFVPTFYF